MVNEVFYGKADWGYFVDVVGDLKDECYNVGIYKFKKEAKKVAECKAKELNVPVKSDWDKYSILENCEDFKILKANLTEKTLKYINKLCAIHEQSFPDEKGKYPCGCIYDIENDVGEHCMIGNWLNGTINTEELIELVKD